LRTIYKEKILKTFVDNAGRTWTIAVHVDSIRRVRDLTGINLANSLSGEFFERLATDPLLLCDVIFALVKPETEAQGVSEPDFARGMAGDAIDRATEALVEGLADFFPNDRRTLLRKAVAKLKALERMVYDEAGRRLESVSLEQEMAKLLSTSGVSSTSSPESSA